MLQHIKTLIRDEEGASAVEYGLLVALIAAVIIVAVKTLGTNLSSNLFRSPKAPFHDEIVPLAPLPPGAYFG